MSEGYIAAILKPSDSELFVTVQRFLELNTDGLKKEQCSQTLVELSGPFFDSWLEDKIDDFVGSLDDAVFARLLFRDEYGTEIFWVIDDGESQKFRHDQEEVSKRVVKAYEALHNGLGSVRKGTLAKDEVAEMKKETSDPRTPIYMDVIFSPPISEDFTTHHFSDGYSPALGTSTQDDYTWIHWFPIGSKSKRPEGLIRQILEATGRDFYAKTYRDCSRTERVIHCSPDGIEILFDTDDYTDEELKYVQAHTEEKYCKVKWTNLDIGKIRNLLETGTLRDYAEKRVAACREEIAEEQRQLEELLAAHPDDREPLLHGVGLHLFYKDLDEGSANDIVRTLQIRGMEKREVDTGLAIGGKNIINVTSRLKPAGEWLVENVDALSDHELVIDDRDSPWDEETADEVDYIVINLS